MAKKITIFISGMVFLSLAWTGTVSSVKRHQDLIQRESLPMMFNLMQSRWEKMAHFNAVNGASLEKPAVFVFKFSGLDLNLIESKMSEGLEADFYLNVKKAYLDAGKKMLFYTLNLESEGRYLVRALRVGGNLETVGFELDAALNYLSQGLEKREWFLVDAKKRVMASDEKAYVGEFHKLGSSFKKFSFEVLGEPYTFAVLKPKGVNLAFAGFMGVLGIFFILSAVYIYTEGDGGASQKVAVEPYAASFFTGESIFKRVKSKVGFKVETVTPPEQTRVDPEIFEEQMPEDVRMVDLTNLKKSKSKLDYTDFLMDNPVLGKGLSSVAIEEELTSKVEKQSKEMGCVSSDDWVKLAEDLSANIDKFTQGLEENKSSDDIKKEV